MRARVVVCQRWDCTLLGCCVRTGSRVKDTLFCKQRAAQEENFDRAIQ
jgi:hypothetical protein